MTETKASKRASRRFRVSHRGRGAQVWIYLGKLLRMFVYQNDWKVLPMAALIAGLVGMVIRRKMFLNMEGTLMGSFALVCVAIWNGCFNSIQVICRERDVIKREHRSGMHISSYISAHMIYQLLLCMLQSGITLYVIKLVGVQFPAEGLFTPWMIVDLGITMLLITYASDMLSLWVSTLAHTTTTAMTIMPFVLIFQLVFSGGMLTLPAWTQPLTYFTISNPGLKAVAAQADTNNRPFVTISDMVGRMRDNEISAEITLGQALDILADETNPAIRQVRSQEVGGKVTVGQLKDALYSSPAIDGLKDEVIANDVTLGALMDALDKAGAWDAFANETLEAHATVGGIIDELAANPTVQAHREDSKTFTTTVGGLLDIVGQDKVKTFLEQKAAEASFKKDYVLNRENITGYWMHLLAFIVAFAALSTITLEFIDKDKR